MREYLRQTADEVWVIDCSPDGHQPEVRTRIFEVVQQPVCIVLASRSTHSRDGKTPATVRFRSLPKGSRVEKFAALTTITLDGPGWEDCPTAWRAPFLPGAAGAWATYPALADLFVYDGSGVMPGRTWVIAPDADSLKQRWQSLINAPDDQKEHLFHPHLRGGKPGDRHLHKTAPKGLRGHASRSVAVADDQGACIAPTRYGYRSFDRQWIIPDARLINQANPELWQAHSPRQVYLTALEAHSPSSGPALTSSALIPDHDHYRGSFSGRVFPLWLDPAGTVSNVRPGLLTALAQRLGHAVGGDDLFAYIAAVTAHPVFTARFLEDLTQPGLRVPITADAALFHEAVELGRTVLWLHSFGERYVDPAAGRPAKAPRLPPGTAPTIPVGGAFQGAADEMPDHLDYDPEARRLFVGAGHVDHVAPEVWDYEVSGKQVIRQWFSYRRKTRERPIIGDRRPPSSLGEVQPERWPAEYTTDLLDMLNVLGRLVELEPRQADLLDRICAGPTVTLADLQTASAFELPEGHPKRPTDIAAPIDATTGKTALLPGLDATPVVAPKKPAKV